VSLDTEFAGDPIERHATGRLEHDPRAPDQAHSRRRPSRQRLKCSTVLGIQLNPPQAARPRHDGLLNEILSR